MKLQADTIRLKPRHALAALCLAAAALTAAPQHSFFAGSENILLQEVPGVAAGQPLWFHVARAGRTLASGPVAATADGHLTLPLTLPEMKPGVVLALDLTLRLGSDQGAPLLANTKAWFFSRYPWPADHNPVAPRQLHLYDPAGDTATALEAIKLPCKRLDRPRALADLKGLPIIIAEGLDYTEERDLWEEITAAASRGCDILILAPAAAQLTPPPAWDHFSAGTTKRLLLPAVKKRPWPLDLTAIPASAPGGTRFQLSVTDGMATLATAPHAGAEALLWELHAPGGRIRLLGNPLISRWEATPAARWLLADLINAFATKKPTAPDPQEDR